jgi:AcrR family transcriptional regulator
MGPLTAADPRDAILDAALRLLPRFGYRKTTLDDLASESGVARRSIYLYFPGKEEIFLASIDRVVERVLAELSAIAAERTAAESRLWRMVVARVMTRFDAVRHYRESLDEMLSELRSSYLARRERYFDAEAQVLAKVIADGVRAEGWNVEDPLEAARVVVQATNSLLPYSLSRAELGSRGDVQARATALANLLARGLTAPKATRVVARPQSRNNPRSGR